MARHGLLIGVSRFDDTRLSALNAPARDVTALAEVLRDPARGGFDALAVSLDEDYLTVRDRLATLFEARDPDDMVLLYYSGHGVLRRGNRLFLATPASELDRPQARSISASEIRDLMDQCRAERQVLILDCCHSGAFGEHAKGAAAAAVTDDTFAGAGRYVLTASDSQQFAWDGGELKEGDTADRKLSSFTSWLVQGIGSAEAAPDEPDITLDSVFRYVCRRARAEGAAATPQSFVDRATGELVIARNPAVASQAEVETQAVKLASEDWAERNTAAEALGKLARRSGTRNAARDALADRLGVERDFKVRAAILKALELRDEVVDGEAPERTAERERPHTKDQGVSSDRPPPPQFSAGEMAVLQRADIPQQQWPLLPSVVVDQARLFARAIFWGRVAVWIAWGLTVLDLVYLVQLGQQQSGLHRTDDPTASSVGLAIIQIMMGLMFLVPSRWRLVATPPPLPAEYSEFAKSMEIVRFKQFFKWSFDPPYELRRLRRAAIILLVSGGLTLILVASISQGGQQTLSSTGYPKY